MVRVVSVRPSIDPSMWGGRFVTIRPSVDIFWHNGDQMPHVNSDQKQKNYAILPIFKHDTRHLKKWLISPEASNAFKLPLFEISILKNKKWPSTLVQILSHGGARGVCYVLPTVEKNA
jgi:hypothetical protein